MNNPRFHCSRCDHYFDLHSNPHRRGRKGATERGGKTDTHSDTFIPKPAQLDLLTKKVLHPEPDFSSSSSSSNFDAFEVDQWATKPLFPEPGTSSSTRTSTQSSTSSSTPSPSSASSAESSAVERADREVTASWPNGLPTDVFEADMRQVLDRIAQRNTAASLKSERNLQNTSLFAEKAPKPQTAPGNTLVDPESSIREETSIGEQDSIGVLRSGRFKPIIESKTTLLSNDDIDEFAIAHSDSSTPRLSLITNAGARAPQKRLRRSEPSLTSVIPTDQKSDPSFAARWSGFAVALSVPFALVCGFGFWSITFDSTPEALAAVTRLDGAELPRLAPAGVDVVSTQSDWIGLESGERVFQVKGTVVNSTERAYKDLVVEVSLFDPENKRIASRVSPAVSGLSTSGPIVALTRNTIDDLQRKPGITRIVRTGEQLPFRVVITDAQANATWFSARVYSLRATPNR